MKKYTALLLIALLAGFSHRAAAQTSRNIDETKSRLAAMLTEIGRREASIGKIKITEARDSLDTLRFMASDNCAYIPMTDSLVDEIYTRLRGMLPEDVSPRHALAIYTLGHELSEYVPLALRQHPSKRVPRFTRPDVPQLVRRADAPFTPDRGLSGRHIAIWHSHGRYYEPKLSRWEWQRARMFTTVEDLYTRSYVMPFLVPMLERAGANVLIPRERDTQAEEIITDNDRGTDSGNIYSETSGDEAWSKGKAPGFAHLRAIYHDGENPFADGSYRQASTVRRGRESTATWRPRIRREGQYAVYVAYHSLPESADDAEYTIIHSGIETKMKVNQRMGGGTWVYLGTFHFTAGQNDSNKVVLTNRSKRRGAIVTADAVRIGGGMGNIARSPAASDTLRAEYQPITSCYPRYTEAARYYMQWAGVPDSIYTPTRSADDYRDDYICRGLWVNWLAGGSAVNPSAPGLGIPVDLTMAFHSDAGTTLDNSIIGTLAIYSTKGGGGKFAGGAPKFISHDLAQLIQSNIVSDIRRTYLPEWTRRGMWNAPYFEAWEPCTPTMLLELLSHQNFADMRLGLDPRFRFTVSRAIYKAMLSFVSSQYGRPCVVSPLAPRSLALRFTSAGSREVELTWRATTDSLEPTAQPDAYVVYKRIGEHGDFDGGTLVSDTAFRTLIPTDTVCSFRVTAVNRGGESFPSETLSAARTSASLAKQSGNTEKTGKNKHRRSARQSGKASAAPAPGDKAVLIINGFTRLSGPASFTAPAPADTALAGFLTDVDGGVAYGEDFLTVGAQKEFRRSLPWLDDDSGGFGDSYGDREARPTPGNTFDYPAIHGAALLAAGCSFCSASAEAVESGSAELSAYPAVDYILGKQMAVRIPATKDPASFRTFSPAMEQLLEKYASCGGNILVSGSYLGSDLWTNAGANPTAADRQFAKTTLHYAWRDGRAARTGRVRMVSSPWSHAEGYAYVFCQSGMAGDIYTVESPDAIEPAGEGAHTVMRYDESGLSAAVACRGTAGRGSTVAVGFPLETLLGAGARTELMDKVVKFFGLR